MPHLRDIEHTGTILISFSEDMRIIPDLRMITQGTVEVKGEQRPVFDVEVIPGRDSDPEKLSFEWNIVEMTLRTVELQLFFEEALQVSANFEPDILRLSFVDKYMFVGTNDMPIEIDAETSWRRRRMQDEIDQDLIDDYFGQYDYDDGYDEDSP